MHILPPGKGLVQNGQQGAIQLHCHHLARPIGQLAGQWADARADLQHAAVLICPRCGGNVLRHPGLNEKILSHGLGEVEAVPRQKSLDVIDVADVHSISSVREGWWLYPTIYIMKKQGTYIIYNVQQCDGFLREKKKNRRKRLLAAMWRRERDSNPRTGINRYTISNRAPSTSSAISPGRLRRSAGQQSYYNSFSPVVKPFLEIFRIFFSEASE